MFKQFPTIGRRVVRRAAALLFACVVALLVIGPITALGLDPSRPLSRYVHEVWQDDLPQNTVHTILQTRDGYLWLGTYEGLVRFNGVDFTVFDKRNTPAIQNNGIRALFEDRGGTLWIGTASGGLVAMKNGEFQAFTTEQGLANNFIYTICEDSDGIVWVGTNGGISRIADGTFSSFTNRDGLSSNKVRSLCPDPNGGLWIGTDGGGLCHLKNDKFEVFTTANGLPPGAVTALCMDAAGHLWIGTDGGGLSTFDGTSFKFFTTADGLSSNRVWALTLDHEGSLWIGTDGGGLNRYRDGAFTSRSLDEGLSDTFVRAICEDFEGSLWIGTNGGLNRLKDGRFTSYTTSDGLSNNFARVVCQDTTGALWIGTDGGGVNRLEGDQFTSYSKKNGLPSDFVRAVWPDRDGSVWVGSVGGGLTEIRNGAFKYYSTKDGLAGDDVRAIYQDVDGALWIGTNGAGISRLADGRFTNWTNADGLANGDVRAITQTRDGALWFATNGGGLCRLVNGKFTTFTTRDGLAADVVFAMYEDADGNLWIGTANGLTLYRDGVFHAFGANSGLFDDLAFQILEDGAGNLWMSCNKGVYRAARADLLALARGETERVTSVSFGKTDGMGSTQCNGASQPAGWRSTDGRLWFPTIHGVSVIDPKRVQVNEIPPPVTISSFVVDGQRINGPDGIRLAPSSNRFEFHYDGLSLLVPQAVRFRYKLEGLDDEWIDAGTRRTAFFTNLPAGTYTFRVMACNNDGVWNEIGAAYRFTLPPPVWRTWWALLLYAAAFASVMLAVHRLRLATLKQRTAVLEREVAARTSELAASEQRALEASRAKSTFLANMSHELRTPMNAILGFVQLMKRDRTLSGEHQENLGIIERAGEHLLALINDVLSISKIEAGHVALNEHAFDLERMLEGLRDTFRLRAEAKGVGFEVDIDPEIPRFVHGDEGKLRQILINLLGNAFKFTEDGGVVLRAFWRDARAIFEVEDTGLGISPNEIDNLFGAFVQTESGRLSQEGTGLGLAISRNYAHLMSGDIAVTSEPGRGTTFRVDVSLPATDETHQPAAERFVIGIEPGQPPIRILVVDDTLENRKLLVKLLSSVGFQVREAANGKEAVEMRTRWHPHLIFMDIRMPVMDGVTATREIRTREAAMAGQGRTPAKIIALTASVFERDQRRVLDAGCDDLVWKPFRESTIFDKLIEHLGVRFVYEAPRETGRDAHAADDGKLLSPARLAALPRELIDDLTHAVGVGDVEALHEIINRICDVDEPLGNELRHLARRYQFEEILETVGKA
ncbi:MAG TPA: two-component regulator propeller domain-containing protein [Blastocatellia bacterium]|nr:two-component regulator propeller domain-containing protein [Blastocatellia bacterium]